MGFCLFNNVAIAARALQAECQVGKVLILDWDVHHGNGTQHSFEEDPSILYTSTHQFPHYPGTGEFGEEGRGRGIGATLNVPMPPGCGDLEYVAAFQRILAPVVRQFRPEFILVSCGFDAHRDDPLASMQITGDGFRDMARLVRSLADELCDGRLLMVLEGGYAATGLYDGMRGVLHGMTESPQLTPMSVDDPPPGSPIHGIIENVRAVHSARYPSIGVA
jgi:acetoin utilization deacetylase AcuC-like enzyme